ncbi:hypothetical protein Pfo_021695 [Paulownia fortunei]|nr:hypothetical protein Pfo_021695 [Paulownia fortunei]
MVGIHLSLIATTIQSGARRPSLEIAPIHHQTLAIMLFVLTVILHDLILVTAKYAEPKDTLPNAALHSVLYQLGPPTTQMHKCRFLKDNQELILPLITPSHQHGYWIVVLLITSLLT